ncbi:hypothetical protein OHA72_09865 [Dactylosporangium sp. NBC_01737]|uniref:hypothetical protein n=1 Tax=Dactylosporangium sp. NBC_01737 TaxID=2975959 RepID=UPI002E129CC5|nr:hypothetical protein OHA72_09865 [Dactylosporangium sp. NBC_01737]
MRSRTSARTAAVRAGGCSHVEQISGWPIRATAAFASTGTVRAHRGRPSTAMSYVPSSASVELTLVGAARLPSSAMSFSIPARDTGWSPTIEVVSTVDCISCPSMGPSSPW